MPPRSVGRRARGPIEAQDFTPTHEQAVAIEAIGASVERGGFAEFLLQGITGSGKTFVYIRAIARTIAEGGRAIVLVPEISLTPQTARRFEGAFGERVAVLHSGLSERERFDAWHAAQRGEIDVVVGARSAVFAPLENLRLLVVDEAHERSYKQDTVPRYHAVDVARERMRLLEGTLVLGSATPPLEAYYSALRGPIVHRAEGLLRCHQCDAQMPIPAVCPKCKVEAIREFGIGTQRVVEAVQALWPRARVIRMDSDTTTRVGDHARLLDDYVARGDILVGTQMVAKGLDFPTVTLVGVVAADIGLHVPDFRAAERTFDLITQVAGRSGRAQPGEAIVQTYSPDHPAIVFAARHDYDGFAARELEQRRELNYPPFGDLIYLGIFGRRRPAALEAAQRYAVLLRERPEGEVLGPAPFAIARANEEWRFRIALKADDGAAIRAYLRETLTPLARTHHNTRLAINVDP